MRGQALHEALALLLCFVRNTKNPYSQHLLIVLVDGGTSKKRTQERTQMDIFSVC